MFRTTIVVWLLLLVLALTAIAFVTRIIEKYKRDHRISKIPERTVSVVQTSELSILKHRRNHRHPGRHYLDSQEKEDQ